MLHCDGSNKGTTFTDSELTPKTVTPVGNVITSTSQIKFGTASALFPNPGLIDSYTVLLLHFDGIILIYFS